MATKAAKPTQPPKRLIGKKAGQERRVLKGAFDAAEDNNANARHWANADSLSADAAANPWIRKKLRERARYEVANNCYARGMLLTLAQDTIGTGPRLQLTEESGLSPEDRRLVQREWAAWSREVRLAAKLRLMRIAKAEAGEAFAKLTNNEKLAHQVKLDLRGIEADQVTSLESSSGVLFNQEVVDGIEFDEWGNPSVYHVLKQHPGSESVLYSPQDFEKVTADRMIHWFRRDREGQSRGVPEIAPALPMFAMLRRYTLATLAAAEAAANSSRVLKTQSNAMNEQDQVVPFDVVDIAPNETTILPEGWELEGFKSEQPTTTYPAGKAEFIAEAARCLNMPYNVASGNSSKYNYSSGRLDHQVYEAAIWVEQADIELVVLDTLLAEWIHEATLIEGYLPQRLRERMSRLPAHQWFWDGRGHVDPSKEASAQATRLQSNTTTLAIEFAREGLDWEEALQQRARELARMRELGIPVPAAHDNTGRPVTPAGEVEDDEQEEAVQEDEE